MTWWQNCPEEIYVATTVGSIDPVCETWPGLDKVITFDKTRQVLKEMISEELVVSYLAFDDREELKKILTGNGNLI